MNIYDEHHIKHRNQLGVSQENLERAYAILENLQDSPEESFFSGEDKNLSEARIQIENAIKKLAIKILDYDNLVEKEIVERYEQKEET